MKWTTAVIKESMRVDSAVIYITRVATKDTVVPVMRPVELIGGEKPKTGKSTGAKVVSASGAAKNQTARPDMPGTIKLDEVEEDVSGGCAC